MKVDFKKQNVHTFENFMSPWDSPRLIFCVLWRNYAYRTQDARLKKSLRPRFRKGLLHRKASKEPQKVSFLLKMVRYIGESHLMSTHSIYFHEEIRKIRKIVCFFLVLFFFCEINARQSCMHVLCCSISIRHTVPIFFFFSTKTVDAFLIFP